MSGASSPPLVQRWAVTAVVVLVTLALVGGNASGRTGLAIAVIAVQAVFGLAWLLIFSMTVDAALMVGFAVVVADVVLLRTRTATAGSIAGVLGISVIAVLFHQIARRGSRGVTEAVAITLSVIVLDTALALVLPLRELPDGRSMVFAAIVTAAAALVVVHELRGPDLPRRLAGLVVAALVGLWCGAGKGGILTAPDGIYLGLATGLAVLLVDRVVFRVPDWLPSSRAGDRSARMYAGVGALVTGLVPLVLAAPVGYLVGRVITSGGG